jgi:hypothetical protein
MTTKLAAFFLTLIAYFLLAVSSPSVSGAAVKAAPRFLKKKTEQAAKPKKAAVNQDYLAVRNSQKEYASQLAEYQKTYTAELKAFYDSIAAKILPATKWSLFDPVKGWGTPFGDYTGKSTYDINEAIKNYAEYGIYGTKPVYNPPKYQ